ncbi:MAG TPA: MoaD/ThiS family protein [Anaerolineaceae bacterium]
MPVTVIIRKKELTFEAGLTVFQLFTRLGLPLEAYLVLRNGELITEDEHLREGDVIELIAVISGG